MNSDLKWKKSLFSNTYRIYSNGRLIGKLEERRFSNSADGIINGEEYIFKTNGLFTWRHTEIINARNNKVIGKITYSEWRTKATLTAPDKKANWKYDNIWNTRWSISSSTGIKIKYAGSTTSGKIDANADDSLLLLSGLYVTNYYRQTSIAIMAAIILPIWASLQH